MVEQSRIYRTDSLIRPRTSESLIRKAHRKSAFILRLTVAALFFWLGMSKLTGISPAITFFQSSIPFFSISPMIEILGIAEIVIALGVMISRLSRISLVLNVLHLASLVAAWMVAPTVVFNPSFPDLTADGLFVVRNFFLILFGLILVARRMR